jgi:hypothetical protein
MNPSMMGCKVLSFYDDEPTDAAQKSEKASPDRTARCVLHDDDYLD